MTLNEEKCRMAIAAIVRQKKQNIFHFKRCQKSEKKIWLLGLHDKGWMCNTVPIEAPGTQNVPMGL
jgi:hypothetical protein